MLGIAGVRTGRRCGVEPQTGIVQLGEPDTGGVIAHHGISAYQAEEGAAFRIGRGRGIGIRHARQKGSLAIGRKADEVCSVAAGGRIEPLEAAAHRLPELFFAMRGEEVDEFGDACFERAGGFVFGDDEVRQDFDGAVFGRGKVRRPVGGGGGRRRSGGGVLVLLTESPATEARELAGGRGLGKHLQDSAAIGSLICHGGSGVLFELYQSREVDGDAGDWVRLRGSCALEVHLIDGTYELFRHYYALPSARDRDGREVAAVRGVVGSVMGMIRGGATHVGVATDHVIESFRNGLWPGYKTSEGVEPELLAQFELLEEALVAAGVVVWPMVEFEADDALASAAAIAARDPRVERVIICTPDKDLAQCVRGTRVVQLSRRTRVTMDEAGVAAKFGVPPPSIPDYLALVGDAADGYPGLPGWGAKSTAAVLAKFGHIESIPADWRAWSVNASNAGALARTLAEEREKALLFRTLATLRSDIPLFAGVEELAWHGA